MTARDFAYSQTALSAEARLLPAELIDSLASLIATSGDPHARACVAVGLLEEVYATVEWLDDLVVSPVELTSLRQVLTEIRAHRDRMAAATQPRGAVA
jgi:hypothetical protein